MYFFLGKDLIFLQIKRKTILNFNLVFVSVRLLSVLRDHSVFSSPPQWPMTSDFEGFSIPDVIHYIFGPIFILQKEPVFPFFNVECQTRELLVPFL